MSVIPLRIRHWFRGHVWQERVYITPAAPDLVSFKPGAVEGREAVMECLALTERLVRGSTTIDRFCACGAHYSLDFPGVPSA